MRYISTRGRAPELGFADVLLAGLAADGGLYVPADWPLLPTPAELDAATGYADTARRIIAPFVGADIAPGDLARMCDEAYASFRHPAVVPLVQIDHRQWLAELFHGPTLAFKDVALQLVGRLFDHVLGARQDHVTIIGATSGDTGSAAIEAVHGCQHVDIVILYPRGGPSEVQRRQMTTVDAPNVRAVAVEGTFDDCQDLVKAMFNDLPFRERMRLSAVNSINWARVMAQVVYYVTAARALGGPITACVPTGNFGNVFAGWVARRMGAPIEDFVIASNENDILTRFVNDADMSISSVVSTLSPSMDIQVSSNFERMLWVMNDGDGARTGEQLVRFRESGRLTVDPDAMDRWITPAFRAGRTTDAEVLAEIAHVHATTGMLIDPHTATGTLTARRLAGPHPVVTMATAHPAKFPDAVERATGIRPALPDHLADLFERPERTETIPNDLAVVEDYVARVSRVG
ncbi:MAG TPA: threonine synthase [Ilumatobacteraceae bacterium]|nr:threonine synthase [Ilumatobacteraceae bacterium]